MLQEEIKVMIDLVQEERDLMRARAYEVMKQGVKIRDPDRFDLRGELICGKEVEIDINVIIIGKVILGDNVKIESHCILISSTIGNDSVIRSYSLVEQAEIGCESFVGPYGRIRPGTKIGDKVQIGNFVEIKDSNVASGCRINHLVFVGDADLAENVTLGACTITCNHDGVGINKLSIGEGAYIGSGCNLVAPLKIEANATIASGSTITKDVPTGKLTIARSRQVTVENWNGPKHRRDEKMEGND